MLLPRRPAPAIVDFDSAALRGSAMLAHRMDVPGSWRLVLRTPGRRPIERLLEVVEGGGAGLAYQWNAGGSGIDDPSTGAREPGGTMRPGTYLRLRSAAGPLSASLYAPGSDEAVWDSSSLVPDDIFACLPLRPGLYTLVNRFNAATSSVVVNYPDPRAIQQGSALATGPVRTIGGQIFTPSHLLLDPGQPLVIETEVVAHFTLTLKTPDDGPPDLVDWRALHDRELLNAVAHRSD